MILILLMTYATGLSQNTITGMVIDVSSGEALAGASIFISNSSIGNTSRKDGSFELANIPSGRHDLVISSVGFETNVFSFSSTDLPLKLRIEMRVKVRELQSVVIEPFVEEGWDRWGKFFFQRFVGETPNAQQCKIKNYQSIRFLYYKKTDRLVAYSDEPIIIENKALGYIITFQLEDFEIKFGANTTSYVGYPYFEEMDNPRNALRKRWNKARDQVYYGSNMHFFRSLYADSLAEQQFELRKMIRTFNLEKERIKPIYRSIMLARDPQSKSFAGLLPLAEDAPEKHPDSLAYYEKILSQKDFTDHYGNDIIGTDSVLAKVEKEAYKVLYFDNYLYVTYKGAKEEQAYLNYAGEKRSPHHQMSFLWLANDQPVAVFENGTYFPPTEVFSMAYWGWKEKISNLLPLDYQPGTD